MYIQHIYEHTIQNAAARIVTFTKKTEHITPVLRKLHWLAVQYRIIFNVLLLVYKGLNGLAPAYISELLHYRTSSRSLRSSSRRLLSLPRTSLKTERAEFFDPDRHSGRNPSSRSKVNYFRERIGANRRSFAVFTLP